MDRSGAQSRTGVRRREPLGDGAARANVGLPNTPTRAKRSLRSTRSPSSATTESSIPHHESMLPNGTLNIRNPRHSDASASSRHRQSDVPSLEAGEVDDKRASQNSNSSQGSNWSRFKKDRVGPWILGSDIGRGMVGKVRKVKHSQTGQLAAAKIIPAKQAEAMRAESLMNLALITAGKQKDGRYLPVGIEREIVIMRLLEHNNIVKLYDLWENRGELYLIMELVNDGELFDYVAEHEHLLEDEGVYIFRQIVAALLNAHRLGIYHRDLKPENILIEIEEDENGCPSPQVKLADFGMAALQPKGKLLTTSCGSIHYAAPEVFEKRYDGGKADVWSLGIILYVMLTGMLPFNELPGDNLQQHWYYTIKSGKYAKPTWLSEEAQNLISMMLVPNPRHRISLENIWRHPLLEKWRDAWEEPEETRNLMYWIGAGPSLEKWDIKTERDIDLELFRNLRVLWHSDSEEVLKKRLLSKEANLEKYFYSALHKHREEALENYVGGSDTLSTSASDYHHGKAHLDPASLPPLPAAAYKRTKSSLSIMIDEPTRERPTAATRKSSTSPSERSYDPYRSSKNAIVGDKENYTVRVHRDGSKYTRQTSAALNVKTNSLRVDTLRKEQNRLSTGSSSVRSRRTSPSPIPAARRSISRSSIVSSVYPSSPPGSIVVRPSSAHRRGVDFSHVRRSSTVSALSAPRSPSRPSLSPTPRNSAGARATNSPARLRNPSSSADASHSSSASPPPPVEELLATLEKAKMRKSKTHSQVIDSEARKISVELEKFCEQAFNRESTASSYMTTNATTTHPPSANDTPPSSISYRPSSGSTQGVTTPDRPSWSRSDSLRDTPNAYLASRLAAARREIAERFANDRSASQNHTYRDVLASLDNLLSREKEAVQADSRRVVSDPSPNSGPLPMITEERALTDEAGSVRHSSGNASSDIRTPRPKAHQDQAPKPDPVSTIRVIEPSSPPPTVAPLNIRKVASPPSPKPSSSQIPAYSNSAALRYYDKIEPQPQFSSRRMPPIPPPPTLHPITEDAASRTVPARQLSNAARRNGWFGGWRRDTSAEHAVTRELSAQRFDSSRRPSRQASVETDLRTRDASRPPFQPMPTEAITGKRPGFLSIFTRKKKTPTAKLALSGLPYTRRRLNDAEARSIENESNNSQTALSTTSTNSESKLRPRGFYHHGQGIRSRVASNGTQEEERALGIQRNWLERFFNIKPASQAMCFRKGRGQVLTELVRLLRSWQSYGINDVVFDREKHLVFASVARDNYLHIKEVAFVIQLFVVLENDRRNNLSVSRFIQRKGAASSFHVVVQRIEQAMRRKGFIVEDPVKKREMEEMLVG